MPRAKLRPMTATRIAEDSQRPTATPASTYEGVVRSTLLKLGSNNPDGDLAASNDYWKHCRAAGIGPEVCAATIYSSVRHKHVDTGHAQTATLREGESSTDFVAPNALENARAYFKLYQRELVDSPGSIRIEEFKGYIRASLLRKDGSIPTWLEARALIDGVATGSADESPTREEWEVVVKRAGSDADSITATAGRRPTEVTVGNAVFAGFNDDEKATAFARKMTKAGYVASSGPSRATNLHEVSEADVGGWWLIEFSDGETGRRHHIHVQGWDKVEALHNADVAMKKAGHTIDYRAGINVQRTMTQSSSYKVNEPLKDAVKPKFAEGDGSAMGAAELAPVISENTCGIPWNKVSRDPRAHAANMELAAKHGAIRNATQVYALVGPALNKEDQEVFLVIPLNLRGELKASPYEVARGQRSRVAVDPSDVLRAALDAGAEGYIVVHCHPTGKAKPSKADIDLTETLKAATKPYGKSLCLLDHVVIGNGEAYSIFERKMYKC
jgi:hypothetical protein